MILYDVLINNIQFYKNDNTTKPKIEPTTQKSASAPLNTSNFVVNNQSFSSTTPTTNSKNPSASDSSSFLNDSSLSSQNGFNQKSGTSSPSLLYLSKFLN
jgi:hypothetical protein